jgi:hypothetical protein
MHSTKRLPLVLSACIALSGVPFSAWPQWVQHCEGPDGETTYTASNCPPDHALIAQQPPKRADTPRAQHRPVKKPIAPKPRAAIKANASHARPLAPEKKSPGTVQQRKEVTQKEKKVQRTKRPIKYVPNKPEKR